MATVLRFVVMFVVFGQPQLSLAAFIDGNELYNRCTQSDLGAAYCIGFTTAISDALDGNTVNGYDACPPSTATGGQVRDIVLKYLRENPASRHESASSLAAHALHEAFPCR
jgi:Ssp1 endopeptidase immunity protein Rap1a